VVAARGHGRVISWQKVRTRSPPIDGFGWFSVRRGYWVCGGGRERQADGSRHGGCVGPLGMSWPMLKRPSASAGSASPQLANGIKGRSPWEGVDLVPAGDQLAAVEVSSANDLVFRMEAAFEGLDTSAYTAVLFDCPPNLDWPRWTDNANLHARAAASRGVCPGSRDLRWI